MQLQNTHNDDIIFYQSLKSRNTNKSLMQIKFVSCRILWADSHHAAKLDRIGNIMKVSIKRFPLSYFEICRACLIAATKKPSINEHENEVFVFMAFRLFM